jgi:hypothetical protein
VDVEHFLSHMAPNSFWSQPLEQAHVAAVRGEIETLIVEALVTDEVDVTLRFGRVGYLFDPRVVTDADGYGGPKPPKEYDPRSYNVTRMKYFKDLSRHSARPLEKLGPTDVARGRLRGLDSFVISDQVFPRDHRGRGYRRGTFAAALKEWVINGGNLILTDRAFRLLPRLGLAKKTHIKKDLYNAGHIDIEDFEDPYTKKLTDTASQTYYEVPLGYSVDEDTSPHWTIARGALKRAGSGGKSVAYINEENRTGLGRVKLGAGTIGVIGALLPRQTEKFDHLFGLADYAVTVSGGQILYNMLAHGR